MYVPHCIVIYSTLPSNSKLKYLIARSLVWRVTENLNVSNTLSSFSSHFSHLFPSSRLVDTLFRVISPVRIIPDSFELVPNNVPDVSASASLGSQRGGSQPRCVQMSAIENMAGGNIAEAVFKLFTISATGKAAYFRPSPSLVMLLKRIMPRL